MWERQQLGDIAQLQHFHEQLRLLRNPFTVLFVHKIDRPPFAIEVRDEHPKVTILSAGHALVPLILNDKITGNTPHRHTPFATERGSKTGRINLSPDSVAIPLPQAKPGFGFHLYSNQKRLIR